MGAKICWFTDALYTARLSKEADVKRFGLTMEDVHAM